MDRGICLRSLKNSLCPKDEDHKKGVTFFTSRFFSHTLIIKAQGDKKKVWEKHSLLPRIEARRKKNLQIFLQLGVRLIKKLERLVLRVLTG